MSVVSAALPCVACGAPTLTRAELAENFGPDPPAPYCGLDTCTRGPGQVAIRPPTELERKFAAVIETGAMDGPEAVAP